MPRLCTIQNTSNSQAKKAPQNTLFKEQLPVAAFKCPLFFLNRKKQIQFFIPPLSLIRSKSCNCIKIKTLFIHNYEKTTPILRFHFTLNFCRRSLIIKDLIKHKNKFNRKFLHDRQFWKSIFRIFIFLERLQKISWTFLGSLRKNYRDIRISWKALKEQCILSLS